MLKLKKILETIVVFIVVMLTKYLIKQAYISYIQLVMEH